MLLVLAIFSQFGVFISSSSYCYTVCMLFILCVIRGKPFSHKDVLSDVVHGQRHRIFSFVQNYRILERFVMFAEGRFAVSEQI